MTTPQEVLAIAKGYADAKYTEGPNNDTVFGKWYGINNAAWCAMFISKCFADVGASPLVAASTKKGFASCDAGLKWFAKNGLLVPIGEARAGDIGFMQFDDDAQPDHVVLIANNNKRLKSISAYEGNTSSGNKGSQSNGDGVFLRKRSYSLFMAVARPKY